MSSMTVVSCRIGTEDNNGQKNFDDYCGNYNCNNREC